MFVEDAFTKETRPLMLTMRFLGWLPMRRAPHPESWKFHLGSMQTLYSSFFLIGEMIAFVYLSQTGIEGVKNKEPSLQLHAFFYLFGLLVPMLLSPFVILQSRSQINFINALARFQNAVEMSTVSGKPLCLGLRNKACGHVTLLYISCVMSILFRVSKVNKGLLKDDVVHLVCQVYVYIFLLWWYFTCLALCNSSQHLLSELKHMQPQYEELPAQLLREYNECGRFASLLDHAVLNLREPWLQLCHLVSVLGDIFALALSGVFFATFGLTLHSVYQIPNSWNTSILYVFIVIAVISSLITIDINRNAKAVQDNVYKNLIEAVGITSTLRISFHTKTMMQDFLLHLSRAPPQISIGGYVTIGQGMLNAFFSSLLMNVVVLIQFNLNNKPALSIEEMNNIANTL